jgi:FixJ family two-component response regulator
MSSPQGRCVVVVDDDNSMSNALARILRLGGYTPLTFTSAEALLESSSAGAAACLVLDVHLPGLTGFELYERLAGMGTKAPVIFITAYDEPESRDQAQSAGAAAFFTKPFSGRDLVEAITRAIAARVRSNGAN